MKYLFQMLMTVLHLHVVMVLHAMTCSMATSVNALKVPMEQTVKRLKQQQLSQVLLVQHVLIAQHRLHALPAQMLLLKILLHVLHVLKLQQVLQAHVQYVQSVQQMVPPALVVLK